MSYRAWDVLWDCILHLMICSSDGVWYVLLVNGDMVVWSMDRQSFEFYNHILILWKCNARAHTGLCSPLCILIFIPHLPPFHFCLWSAKLPSLSSSWMDSRLSSHICWMLGKVADTGVTVWSPEEHICDSSPYWDATITSIVLYTLVEGLNSSIFQKPTLM